MDADRFDAWTQSLVGPGSRRHALRLLAGGALGGLLGLAGAGEEAAARCPRRKRTGKLCTGPAGCCSGICGCVNGQDCTCRKPTCSATDGAACVGTTGCCDGKCTAQGKCAISGGGCTPACTGGRTCENGQCVCPTGTKLCPFDPEDRCRECCIDDDCGGNLMCDHNQGSICRCSQGFDCGQGICWPCCSDDQCTASGFAKADGFYCDVETHSCRCGGGRSMCDVGPNGTKKWACVALSSNASCGFGCSSYGPCTGGRECINHECQLPA